MSIYDPLRDYLRNLTKKGIKEVTLSFTDVENILCFSLKTSPYRFPQWWENDQTGTHPQAVSWLSAGWEKTLVDIASEKVIFQQTAQSRNEITDREVLPQFFVKCAYCNGTGKDPGPGNILGQDCRKCKGTGKRILSGNGKDYIKDDICGGTGRDQRNFDPWEPCHICDGTGKVKK